MLAPETEGKKRSSEVQMNWLVFSTCTMTVALEDTVDGGASIRKYLNIIFGMEWKKISNIMYV